MTMQYNDPRGGDDSNIGTQFNVDYYKKQALIEVKKEMFFGQMADTTNMPKNMGKTIKLYHYLPLLDDSNINDQGLDAAGASVNQKVSIPVTRADGSIPYIPTAGTYILGATAYIIGEGATDQLAGAEAILNFNLWAESSTASGGLGVTLVGGDEDLKFWDAVNPTDGLVYVKGFRFGGLELLATGTVAAGVDALAVPESGNLYGSSKDVGTIAAKLPLLSENGGRVNRVGFKRREIEGSIIKFGFFDEYTKESVDFDTDSQLQMHINREMIFGANEITEDALQIDLLNGAGIVRFGGAALQTSDLQGNTGGNGADLVTYNDLMKLSIDLDNNRCPKDTEIITGTRIIDTRVVNAARYMYIGTELTPMVKKMTDNFSKQAFISVEKYASGATLARGEIGTVDQFRIIVVPEMMHYSGAGATVATNAGYRETNGKYDVFPMLVVGSKSFTTIGFQTDGKTVKFKIKHSKPESDISYANDPYGETGFMSIKWYYGSIITRPERIALVKTVAEW